MNGRSFRKFPEIQHGAGMDPRGSARRIFDGGRQVRNVTRDVIYPGGDNVLTGNVFSQLLPVIGRDNQSAKFFHRLTLTYSISIETAGIHVDVYCATYFFFINFLTLKARRFTEWPIRRRLSPLFFLPLAFFRHFFRRSAAMRELFPARCIYPGLRSACWSSAPFTENTFMGNLSRVRQVSTHPQNLTLVHRENWTKHLEESPNSVYSIPSLEIHMYT